MKQTILLLTLVVAACTLKGQTLAPSADTITAFSVTLKNPAVVATEPFPKTTSIVSCGFYVKYKRLTARAGAGAIFPKEKTLFTTDITVGYRFGKRFEVGVRGLFTKGMVVPTTQLSCSGSIAPKLSFTIAVGAGAALFNRSEGNTPMGRNGNINQQNKPAAFAVDGLATLRYHVYKSFAVLVNGGTLFYTGNNMLPYLTCGVEISPIVKRKTGGRFCKWEAVEE